MDSTRLEVMNVLLIRLEKDMHTRVKLNRLNGTLVPVSNLPPVCLVVLVLTTGEELGYPLEINLVPSRRLVRVEIPKLPRRIVLGLPQ
jgi:hypothetical protein